MSELTLTDFVNLVQYTLNPAVIYPSLASKHSEEKGARTSLYMSLILNLFDTGGEYTFSEVKKSLETYLGNVSIDRDVVTRALDLLLNEKPQRKIDSRIDSEKNDVVYYLSDAGKSTVLTIKQRSRNLSEEAIIEFLELFSHIFPEQLDDSSKQMVAKEFERIMSSLVEDYGFQMYSILKEADEDILSKMKVFDYSPSPYIAGENPKISQALTKISFEIFDRFAKHRKIREYASRLLVGRTMISILGLDPSLIRFLNEDIRRKTFILDTNVLVAAVINTDKVNLTTHYLLSIAKKFQMNLVYTERTELEIEELLKSMKDTIRDVASTSSRVREKVLERLRASAAISFFREGWMEWEDFEQNFRETLSRVLSEFNISKLSDYPDVSNEALLISKELQRGTDKSISESDHDAFHIALVRSFRAKERDKSAGRLIWPDFWFLTWDQKLHRFERFCRGDGKSRPVYDPSCITGFHLSLLIDPYLIMKGEGYTELSTLELLQQYGLDLSQAAALSPSLEEVVSGVTKETVGLMFDSTDENKLVRELVEKYRKRLAEFIIEVPPKTAV